MKAKLDVEIIRKGDLFLASAPEFDIVTRGKTAADAREKLKELVKARLQEMKEKGTLKDFLKSGGLQE